MKKNVFIFILLLIFILELIFTLSLLLGGLENISKESVLKEEISGERSETATATSSSLDFGSSKTSRVASPSVEDSLTNLELKLLSDKTTYHSGEILNLDFRITANGSFFNAKVVVEGILGKLNQEKTLNLKKGENNISFNHTLPRCNVCGGISEGEYTILGKVIIGEKEKETSTKINILQ